MRFAKKKLLAFAVCFALSGMLCFAACDEEPAPQTPTGGPQNELPPPDGSETPPPAADTFTVVYRDYEPQKFGKSVQNEVTKLGDGVHLVKNTVVKTNGNTSVVYAIEVDLRKAEIHAGSTGNSIVSDPALPNVYTKKAAPYTQAKAWESATGGHVYASVNADFFGEVTPNVFKPVNAFVKDGVILKDGHNDKGGYNYTNDDHDVPASAPMLFGVKGDGAQIAPIRAYTGDPKSASVKETLVKSKLSYAVYDGKNYIPVSENSNPSADGETLSFRTADYTAFSGVAVKVARANGITALTVSEKKVISGRTNLETSTEYGWLVAGSASGAAGVWLNKLAVGDSVSLSVVSEDGAWNGYETILGCRHALVVDDAIAATVSSEHSNGAQSPDVPRTAVGLKDKDAHTVVVFCVESMYYGGRSQTGDTHGMNLPELAEFAYFYGCKQAANFDGGGSSHLVVRGDGETSGKTLVRSSDTGSDGLENTRPVLNSLLVTKRAD